MTKNIITMLYADYSTKDGIYYDIIKNKVANFEYFEITENTVMDDGCEASCEHIEDVQFKTQLEAIEFCRNYESPQPGLPRWYRVIDNFKNFEQEYIALDEFVDPIDKLASDPEIKWY